MSSFAVPRDSNPDAVAMTAPAPNRWLINPVVDWLFACGASIWFIFALFAAGIKIGFDNPVGVFLWLGWILGVHLICNAHSTISWVRVIKHEPTRKQVGKTLLIWAGICLTLFICACSSKDALTLLARVYVTVVIQHYLMQSYGVCLLYCIKSRYILNPIEKKVLLGVFWSLTILTAIRAFTFKDWAPGSFWQLPLPFWGPLPRWLSSAALLAFQLSVLSLCGVIVRKYIKEKLVFPLHALFLIFTSICLYYFTFFNQPVIMVFFIAAYYHGTQNLIIGMSQYAKEHGLTEGLAPRETWRALVGKESIKMFIYCCIVGDMIYLGFPAACAYFKVIDWTTAALAAYSCIGLHHVVTEALVYKLRDPRLRKQLVG